jgi:hypothetical protein
VLGGPHPLAENRRPFSFRFSMRTALWELPRFSLGIKSGNQTDFRIFDKGSILTVKSKKIKNILKS